MAAAAEQFELPPLDDAAVLGHLGSALWTYGMQRAFLEELPKVAKRYVIVDDSASMWAKDGKIVGEYEDSYVILPATRWEEVGQVIEFHSSLFSASNVPTEYRLLNVDRCFTIGTVSSDGAEAMEALGNQLKRPPKGATPLCKHVREVVSSVRSMQGQLVASGQKVVITITSDGEPSDGTREELLDAMRPLTTLPVRVVLRLCTEEDSLIEYWNAVDRELGLKMDVLDDIESEAAEVRKVNRWLTYAHPLHLMRQCGVCMAELDVIDEDTMKPEQLYTLCRLIFGGAHGEWPNPALDMVAFLDFVEKRNAATPHVWCPINRDMRPWIDMAELRRKYRRIGGVFNFG